MKTNSSVLSTGRPGSFQLWFNDITAIPLRLTSKAQSHYQLSVSVPGTEIFRLAANGRKVISCYSVILVARRNNLQELP